MVRQVNDRSVSRFQPRVTGMAHQRTDNFWDPYPRESTIQNSLLLAITCQMSIDFQFLFHHLTQLYYFIVLIVLYCINAITDNAYLFHCSLPINQMLPHIVHILRLSLIDILPQIL